MQLLFEEFANMQKELIKGNMKVTKTLPGILEITNFDNNQLYKYVYHPELSLLCSSIHKHLFAYEHFIIDNGHSVKQHYIQLTIIIDGSPSTLFVALAYNGIEHEKISIYTNYQAAALMETENNKDKFKKIAHIVKSYIENHESYRLPILVGEKKVVISNPLDR
jgi:hypothetical protein